MNKNKKLLGYIVVITFSVIMTFLCYKDMVIRQLVPTTVKVCYVVIAIFIALILFLILRYISKRDITPEKFFLIFGGVIGSIYLMATPILKAHDEMYHWYKSYAVSLFEFLPTAKGEGAIYDSLPQEVQQLCYDTGIFYERNYAKTLKAFAKMELKQIIRNASDEYILIDNTPTSYYPFIQMVPQAIGIALSRCFGANILVQAYFGRIGNLLFFLFSGYFALKLLPNRKYILLLLLLCPKVLYISSSLSGDVFTNGVCILFISYLLNIISSKKVLSKRDYFALTSLLICVSICKIVYIPLCFLIFMIPCECFGNCIKDKGFILKNKKKLIITISLVLGAIIIGIVWLKISTGYLSFAEPNSNLQVMYVLRHPFEYCATLLRNIFLNTGNWALDMVGGYMQWGQNFELYPFISLSVYVLMFFSSLIDEEKFELSIYFKIFTLIIFLVIVVLILSSLYVQWNSKSLESIGTSIIIGVQGRYFTAVFMLLPFTISNQLIKSSKKIPKEVTYAGIIVLTLPALLSIIVRNII